MTEETAKTKTERDSKEPETPKKEDELTLDELKEVSGGIVMRY